MSDAILVIEDEPFVREMVDLMLTQAGYVVATAKSGAIALDILQHMRPSLILLDINMPGMSGLDVLRTIRRNGQITAPVLMLTANQSAETVREVMALGGNGYVLKPFTVEVLLGRVRKALSYPGAVRTELPTGSRALYL